jgi:hypothetical protein
MGRILVEIDIHEGLSEILDIEWRGRHTIQRLDYQGIPFRCSRCHCIGHLRRDCSGKVSEDKSEDSMVQEDPPKYMMEGDSLGDFPVYIPSDTNITVENSDSLTSKLRNYYPSLFYSLTLWERQALNNSGRLSHTKYEKTAQTGRVHKKPITSRPTPNTEPTVDLFLALDTELTTVKVPIRLPFSPPPPLGLLSNLQLFQFSIHLCILTPILSQLTT